MYANQRYARPSHGDISAIFQTILLLFSISFTGQLLLDSVCPTRWTVCTANISAILSEYTVLCIHLLMIITTTTTLTPRALLWKKDDIMKCVNDKGFYLLFNTFHLNLCYCYYMPPPHKQNTFLIPMDKTTGHMCWQVALLCSLYIYLILTATFCEC